MKQKVDEAKRWFAQARHDFLVCKKHLKDTFYADACYSAEQAAQKALKACLYFQGERFVWEHSIANLVKKCVLYDPGFKNLIDKGKILDQYYIPTRYPDALAPPAVPFESYTLKEAKEAFQIAEEILKKVETSLSF